MARPMITTVERTSLGDEVAGKLREAIVVGSLPPGRHLREEGLSVELGVSRGPIRDALRQLGSERLLTLRPYRGAVVAPITARDIEEVYTLRACLEPLAVRLAVARASVADLEALRSAAVRVPVEDSKTRARDFAQLDVDFHDLVYRVARNRRLYDVWGVLRHHAFRFLVSRNLLNPDYILTSVPEHAQLVTYIAQGDLALAEPLVARHLEGAYTRLLAAATSPHQPSKRLDRSGDLTDPTDSHRSTSSPEGDPTAWSVSPSDLDSSLRPGALSGAAGRRANKSRCLR